MFMCPDYCKSITSSLLLGDWRIAVIRISNSDRFVIEFIEENHKLVIIIDIETSSAVNSTHLDFMRCTDQTHGEPCVVCERNM